MRTTRLLSALALIAFVVYSCKKNDDDLPNPNPNPNPNPPPIVIQPPPAFGYYVVGYFPSYRNLADVPDVKFKMCNVVNYAFF